MLFFYIRHGDPIYTPDSLTELGKQQAEALAKRLSRYDIDQIYASTSKRAIDTATPTANALGKDIVTLDFCHENLAWKDTSIDIGDGRRAWTFAHPEAIDIMHTPEVRALGNGFLRHPYFNEKLAKESEGLERIERETYAFFETLGFSHDAERKCYHRNALEKTPERVALFAHEGFGMAFLSVLLDVPYPIFSTHFGIGHTGMTVIEFAENGYCIVPRVLQHSNDSHIYKEGIPTNYQNRLFF